MTNTPILEIRKWFQRSDMTIAELSEAKKVGFLEDLPPFFIFI